MSEEKVSVVIPCYNQGKYIQEAIDSVLAQTYKDIEIVVVNDASTDNSQEIINNYNSKYSNIVCLQNKENKGVIYSRNTAIENANGEYILPLDADDKIEPTYIEKAVKVLDENPNIGIVYCKAKTFGSINKYWDLKDFDKSDILYENCIFCSALFRKTDFINVGMYKDYMKYGCEDYDLWLSFIEKGFEVYRIDEILFSYRKYNEESRTTICSNNQNEIWKHLIKNHLDLYLEDRQFIDRLMFNDGIKLKKKYKKYKKLCNIFLIFLVVEFLFSISLTILFLIRI